MSSLPLNSAPSVQQPTNGVPRPKKKVINDPFFKPKKATFPPRALARPPLQNGHLAPASHLASRPSTPNSQRSASPARTAPTFGEQVSGFSDPNVTARGIPYRDYKVVVTKRDLLEGFRFHLAQLPGDKLLDIANDSDFTKPVRLHRRSANSTAPGPAREEIDQKDGLNQEQREELNLRKEARQKEREANLAQIAPSASTGRKLNNFKKKTQQVYRPDYTLEERRRIQTNYEEKLPWHLEDFDNKHTFVGKHQVGSTRVHAALVSEQSSDGSTRFRLLPVEKIYQFREKRDVVKPLTYEEAERAMKKGGFLPEILLRKKEAAEEEVKMESLGRAAKGLFSGAIRNTIAGRDGEEADLDFDDDFADDEEGDLFIEKDEDAKIADKKIKEDQLQSNFFDFKDLKEEQIAEDREKKDEIARKEHFRGIRKALERRERNYNHGSDSDADSVSHVLLSGILILIFAQTDSEEERERIEKDRLAKIAKDAAEGEKSNLPSSGTNTPSGRKEKHGGMLSDREGKMTKSSSSNSLKRPGSPNLSDASGTDRSVRKKKLKSRHLSTSSTQPTPQPSRPISPANVPSSSAPSNAGPKKRKSTAPNSNAGSDTETAAYSGNDTPMSDGGGSIGPRRLKLNVRGPGPGSRSPSTSTPVPEVPPVPQRVALPTVEEIRSRLPPQGISVKDLIHYFKLSKPDHQAFIALVRGVARHDKETKLLFPKK
jgi:transcription initiation factor TFIIF subunit alpha